MGIAELQAIDPRELQRFAQGFGETIRSLPFQLPESFLLLIRTISLISGVTSALDKDFNMWDAVDPFARNVLSSSGPGAIRDLGKQAVSYATTIARLPNRLNDLVTRIDRGEVSVKTPDVDRRLRSIERSLSRLTSAIVFAALIVGGVLIHHELEVLSWVLIGLSAVPLLHVIMTWRSRQ
jgi:predicted unusual protein kinase regulating ubiquinone biosynthesis (AarF/ABC1/UbiB family)